MNQLTDTNPKTAVGRSKPDFSLVPQVAIAHTADAFMDGAKKYGPYNWREKTVSLRTYIAAAQRHLAQFLDGEETASDSDVKHLGHVMACCAIMLDAQSVGNAIDDRPVPGKVGKAIDNIQARRSNDPPKQLELFDRRIQQEIKVPQKISKPYASFEYGIRRVSDVSDKGYKDHPISAFPEHARYMYGPINCE